MANTSEEILAELRRNLAAKSSTTTTTTTNRSSAWIPVSNWNMAPSVRAANAKKPAGPEPKPAATTLTVTRKASTTPAAQRERAEPIQSVRRTTPAAAADSGIQTVAARAGAFSPRPEPDMETVRAARQPRQVTQQPYTLEQLRARGVQKSGIAIPEPGDVWGEMVRNVRDAGLFQKPSTILPDLPDVEVIESGKYAGFPRYGNMNQATPGLNGWQPPNDDGLRAAAEKLRGLDPLLDRQMELARRRQTTGWANEQGADVHPEFWRRQLSDEADAKYKGWDAFRAGAGDWFERVFLNDQWTKTARIDDFLRSLGPNPAAMIGRASILGSNMALAGAGVEGDLGSLTVPQASSIVLGPVGAQINPWSPDSVWAGAGKWLKQGTDRADGSGRLTENPLLQIQATGRGAIVGATFVPLYNLWTGYMNGGNEAMQFLENNRRMQEAPPEVRNYLNMAQLTPNFGTGAQAQAQTIDDLETKLTVPAMRDEANRLFLQAQGLEQQAVTALAAGDSAKAALLRTQAGQAATAASAQFQRANEWDAKTWDDIIYQRQDILGEMGWGVALDPLNVVDPWVDAGFGAVWGGIKSLYRGTKGNVPIEELAKAVQEGYQIAGALEAGLDVTKLSKRGNVLAPNWDVFKASPVEAIGNWFRHLVERTPESEAHRTASDLLGVMSRVFNGVDNVADAQRILDTLLTEPQKLVTGLDGLTGNYFKQSGGVLRVGEDVLLNPEVARRLPVLQVAADALRKATALADPKQTLDVPKLWAEFDSALYRSTRRVLGASAIDDLPIGAASMQVLKVAPKAFNAGASVKLADGSFGTVVSVDEAAQTVTVAGLRGEDTIRPGSQAIWRNGDVDTPVTITGVAGKADGQWYYTIEGSKTGIPESQIMVDPAMRMGKQTTVPISQATAVKVATGADAKRVVKGDLVSTPQGLGIVEDVKFGPGNKTVTVRHGDQVMPHLATEVQVYKPVKAQGERAVILFKDQDGGDLATTTLMSPQEAKLYEKHLTAAIKAGYGDKIMKAIDGLTAVQRGFLSDMWLRLRPGHWVRNATSATAALMADGIYSIETIPQIIDDFGKFFPGSFPTERVMKAFTNTDNSEHWTRAQLRWKSKNPYAAGMDALNEVWSGMTSILGRVPFGEQAFYVRALHKSFMRGIAEEWTATVGRTLDVWLREFGAPVALRKDVVAAIAATGARGGKDAIRKKLSEMLASKWKDPNLRGMGIPAEVFSLDGELAMEDVLKEWQRTSRQADDPKLMEAIDSIIRAEMYGPAERLRVAPPQPTVGDWTFAEIAEDAAGLATRLGEYMMRSGMPADVAQAQAFAFAQEIAKKESDAWTSLVLNLQQTASPGAMNVAFDLMAEVYEKKEVARRAVDMLSRAAVEGGSDALWKVKWEQTQALYTKLSDDVQGLFAQAGVDLGRVLNGEEVPRRYRWDAAVQRYLDWDEQVFRDARTIELGGVDDTERELWQKVIDANRQFVDRQYVAMFEAFRKYPSVEALDVIRSTMKQTDIEGARAAAFLQPLRDELGAAKARKARNFGALKAEYQRIRNATWNGMFDNQASYVLGGTQAIIADGLGKKNVASLRWQPANIFEGHFLDDGTPTTYVLVGATDWGTLAGYDLNRNVMDYFGLPGGGRNLPVLPSPVRAQISEQNVMAAVTGAEKVPNLIEWVDEAGATWTLQQYDPVHQVWHATSNRGDYRIFSENTRGGLPEVPRNVYDNWLRITDQAQQQAAIDGEIDGIRQSAQVTPVTRVNAGQETPESVSGINTPVAPVSPQIDAVSPVRQAAGEAPTVDGGQLQLADAWWADLPEELQERMQRGLPIEEPVRPVPQAVPRVVREEFRGVMKAAYNLNDEMADMMMPIADGRAAVWARQTGREAAEWYPAHIASVQRGGDAGAGALFQRLDLDTPEFRQWFGDSVVRESDGAPKVMYHGTATGDFDTFDVEKQNPESLYGPGFYFTEEPKVAAGTVEDKVFTWYFATKQEADDFIEREGIRNSSTITPPRNAARGDKFQVTSTAPMLRQKGYAWRNSDKIPIEERPALLDGFLRMLETRQFEGGETTTAALRKRHSELANEWARGEAESTWLLTEWLDKQVAGPGSTYPVYLTISKPFDADLVPTADDVQRYLAALDDDARDLLINGEQMDDTLIEWNEELGQYIAAPNVTNGDILRELYHIDEITPFDARKWFNDLGYDGITHIGGANTGTAPHRVYIAFDPGQIKSAIANRGTWDAANPSMLAQAGVGAAKGSTEFLDDGRAILRGLTAPDVSTAVHELAHVFRRDLADVAKIDARAADDMRVLEAWARVRNGTWTVEAEEQFARGFERYLAEGVAPSPALQGAFSRFRQWLAQIYRSLQNIFPKNRMSPQVRGVFDRLLADMPDVSKMTPELQDLVNWGEEAGIRGQYMRKGDGAERTQVNHLINAVNKAAEEAGLPWKMPGAQSVDAWIKANPQEYRQAIALLRERAGRLWNETPTGERIVDLVAEFEQRRASLESLLEMYRQRMAEGLSFRPGALPNEEALYLRDMMRRAERVQEQLDAHNGSLTALMVRQGEEDEVAEAAAEVTQVAPQRPVEAPRSVEAATAVPETPVAQASPVAAEVPPITESPRIGGEFALENAVTTPQGSGSIVGINRKNGQLRSYDVQLDTGEMLEDVPFADVQARTLAPEASPASQLQGVQPARIDATAPSGGVVAEGPVAPRTEAEMQDISLAELERVELVRQWGDQWQYKFYVGGGWKYADSKEGAIESAVEAYRKAKPEELLSRAERDTQSGAARYADYDSRYGRMSMEEVKALRDRDRGVRGVGPEKEFTGTGGRRTKAAVANQGAREAQESAMMLNIYLRERVERALANGETVPPSVLADYPNLAPARVPDVAPENVVQPGTVPAVAAAPTIDIPAAPAYDAKLVDRMRKTADGMENQIQQKLNPPIASQNVTARRSRIAAGMYEEARGMQRTQQILRRLADLHETGEVPALLAHVTTRADVETLLRWEKMPSRGVRGTYVNDILAAAKGKRGTSEAQRRLMRAGFGPGGKSDWVTILPEQAEAIRTLLKVVGDDEKVTWAIRELKNDLARMTRIDALGIRMEEDWQAARTAALALTSENETNATRQLREAERNLIGLKIPGYFPTPKGVIDTLLGRADIQPGMKVLEPSAGKGSIADAIREEVPDAQVDVVEVNSTLRGVLEMKGYKPADYDFMEFSGGPYDRIVMNPPFENGQDAEHVMRAYEMLAPGGRLVAITGEGIHFRNDKKATAFRAWLDEVGGYSEKLPDKAFMSSDRPTGVATRVVVIDKPGATVGTVPARAEAWQPVNLAPATYDLYRNMGATADELRRLDEAATDPAAMRAVMAEIQGRAVDQGVRVDELLGGGRQAADFEEAVEELGRAQPKVVEPEAAQAELPDVDETPSKWKGLGRFTYPQLKREQKKVAADLSGWEEALSRAPNDEVAGTIRRMIDDRRAAIQSITDEIARRDADREAWPVSSSPVAPVDEALPVADDVPSPLPLGDEAAPQVDAVAPMPGGAGVEDIQRQVQDAMRPGTTQNRAAAGGEVGPNGEWYPGGAFIATTDMPKQQQRTIQAAASKTAKRGPNDNAVPEVGQTFVYDRLGPGVYTTMRNGKAELYESAIEAAEELRDRYQKLVDIWNGGQRTIDLTKYPQYATRNDIARYVANKQPIPGTLLDLAKREFPNVNFEKWNATTLVDAVPTPQAPPAAVTPEVAPASAPVAQAAAGQGDGVITVADTSLPQWEQDLLNTAPDADGARYVRANGKTLYVQPEQTLTGDRSLVVSLAAQKKAKDKRMVAVRYAMGEQPESIEFTSGDVEAAKKAWLKQQPADVGQAYGLRAQENEAARKAGIPDEGQIVAVRSKTAEESASGNAWRIEYRIRGLDPVERSDIHTELVNQRASPSRLAIFNSPYTYALETRRVNIDAAGRQTSDGWRLHDYGSEPTDMVQDYMRGDSMFRAATPMHPMHPNYKDAAEVAAPEIPGTVRFDGEENTYAEVFPMSDGRWGVRVVDGDSGEVVPTSYIYKTREQAMAKGETIRSGAQAAAKPDKFPIGQRVVVSETGRHGKIVEDMSMRLGNDRYIQYAVELDNGVKSHVMHKDLAAEVGEAPVVVKVPKYKGKAQEVKRTWDDIQYLQESAKKAREKAAARRSEKLKAQDLAQAVEYEKEYSTEMRNFAKWVAENPETAAQELGWPRGKVEALVKMSQYTSKSAWAPSLGSYAYAWEAAKRQLDANPTKWKVGMGVGYRVSRDQINRGYRIISIDPDVMTARVRPVRDTGITMSGGDSDRLPTETVPLGDLVRSKQDDGVIQDAVQQAPPAPRVDEVPVTQDAPVAGQVTPEAVPLPVANPGLQGNAVRAWSDPARPYTLQYEVVELDDLIASNTPDGRINPQYPPELQPRDRTQAESRGQVQRIATRLAPAELLADTNAIDRGAPIIDARNAVASGNGRTMALRMAAPEKYNEYRAALNAAAMEYGIDTTQLATMRRPVLVRRLPSDVDPVAFAQEANARVTLSMNAGETSKVLAGKIAASDLSQFDPRAANNLKEALSSAGSREFVRRVFARIAPNERAALVDASGNLTTQGIDTIRGALFSVVFPNEPAILTNYVMNPDPMLANIGNGIERAIARLAQLQLQSPDVAVGDQLGRAATLMWDIVRRGESVETRLAQMGLFEAIDDETKLLLQFLSDNARSGKAIGDMLNRYASRAVEYLPGQNAMFAGATPSRLDLLQSAISRGDEGQMTMYGGLGMVPPIDWRTMFGARNLADVRKRAQGIGKDIRAYWRKPKQEEMGDVALHQVRTLEDARKRIIDSLPDLAKPRDGRLPAGVQKELMDRVDRVLLPAHDNAVYGAMKSAQAAADGAMLNYQDRRGFDTLLGYVFPFSYYWTRGGMQWAKRLARKPALANMVYESQRQVDLANERGDVPNRLKGTIFVRQGENGKYYLRNPMEYILPSYFFMPNRFDNPDQARGPAEKAWLQVQQMTPGFHILPDIMMAAGMDAMYGVKPGEHGALADYTLRGFVPLAGIAMDARQAMTGDAATPWTGGDRFNQYRVRRSIGVQAEQQQFGEQDRMAAQYARQIALNLEQGKERYTDVPKEFQQRADEIYRDASKQAGKERLLSSATGWGLGNTAYYVPDAEMELQRQNQEYQAAGFSDANPAGSAEARRAVLEANPNIPLTWGNSVTEGERTPAQSAEQSRMYSDLEKNVYGPEAEEITKAITDALAAGKGDKEIGALVADIKAKYYDLGQEVRAKYPNQPPAGLGGPASGSNPWEQAIDQLTDILNTSDLAYPEYPGDNATQAQKDEYYRLRNDYYSQKASLIAKRIDAAMYTSQMDPKASESDLILADMLRRVPVDTLEREFKKLKYASEAEVDWKRAADARTAEITNAMMTMFGDARMKEFEHYNSLTGEARSKYNDDKPYLAAMSVMTYHPDEYRRAIETFGEESWLAWANRPVGEKGAYYDQYPDAFLVNAWIYGRYDDALGSDLQKLASSTGDVYDFGKDYEEAMRKFGDDIWKIVTDYSSSWSKKQKSAYIKAHQVITDFWDWWYGPKETGDNYRSGYYRSNYKRYYKRYSRRSYGGYGGYSRSSYGGYSGGGGGGYTPYVRMPEVWNRDMDKNLRRDFVRNPYQFATVAGTGPYWMEAGENLKPGRAPEVERWQPRRVWK